MSFIGSLNERLSRIIRRRSYEWRSHRVAPTAVVSHWLGTEIEPVQLLQLIH